MEVEYLFEDFPRDAQHVTEWLRIENNSPSDSDVKRRSINCDADAAAALIIRSKFVTPHFNCAWDGSGKAVSDYKPYNLLALS